MSSITRFAPVVDLTAFEPEEIMHPASIAHERSSQLRRAMELFSASNLIYSQREEVSISRPSCAKDDYEVKARVNEDLQAEATNALKCFSDDDEIRSIFARIRTLIEDVTNCRDDITEKNVALIHLRRENVLIKPKKLTREEQSNARDEIALATRELEDARKEKNLLDVELRSALSDAILIVSQLARNERLLGSDPSGCVERLAEDIEIYVFSKFLR